jgi:hypothetical protein
LGGHLRRVRLACSLDPGVETDSVERCRSRANLKADDVWHQDTVSPEKDDGCGGTRNSDRGIWASPDVRDPSDEDRNGCF